jgi:deoxyadenosine/deoxycytidine kinase
MKIDKHFQTSESSKSYSIYILCLKITRIKPSITAEVLLTRKNFRDKFIKWANMQKDSFDSIAEAKEKPKSISDILGLKPYIAIPNTVSVMIMEQIDIKSPHFKPHLYFQKAHGKLSAQDVSKALENLKAVTISKQNSMSQIISENSIIFGETRTYFEELKSSIAGELTTGPAIMFHNKLKECESTESALLSPLLKQRAEMERIKRLIQLTNKYSYLFKLPNTLQSHLSRADIDSIVDVYQKHVVIIKTYSHLPVFFKVVKNLDAVVSAVKTFILQGIRKNKRLTFESVTKAISYLKILDPKSSPEIDVAQVLYEVIDNYVVSMWTRIDKQHELPWLIKEDKNSKTDSKLQQIAVEQLIIRILDTVYTYIEILIKLSTQTSGKKIKRKLQKISAILTQKLSMSLFQDDPDEPLRSISTDEVSYQIKKIIQILQVPSFTSFCEEFTISVIKTKFYILQSEINELWREETWSKDFENKNGTCMPRIFQCMITQIMTKLQDTLPCFQENVLGFIGEGVSSCCIALLHAMKTALNSDEFGYNSTGKSQRTLLTLSNCEYLAKKVFPQITKLLEGLFSSVPESVKNNLNVITNQDTFSQLQQFSEALKSFFIENKSAKFAKIIEEGITYQEESLGVDANIFYKHIISEKKYLSELRSYINVIVGNIVKIVHQFDRKSPQLKKELLSMLIEEIAINIRKIIQKHHRNFDSKDIIQLWAEIEFFQEFVAGYKTENLRKCYHNLCKVFSKLNQLPKLASESDIFDKDFATKKSRLISSEMIKVKLMQKCLE